MTKNNCNTCKHLKDDLCTVNKLIKIRYGKQTQTYEKAADIKDCKNYDKTELPEE